MPEIWLNYGVTDVVLDIKTENLEQKIDSAGKVLDDDAIREKLNTLDLSKPMDLVVLHNSQAIQKIISSLFLLCEQKSKPFPNILAEKSILNLVKSQLPEGSSISEFGGSDSNNAADSDDDYDDGGDGDSGSRSGSGNSNNNNNNRNNNRNNNSSLSNSNLVFMGEMEFDGLFGYETIATRLVKKFSQESMLLAYAKRLGNLPAPGQSSESLAEAKKFTDSFEIQGIEIIANSEGIVDFTIDHPSKTITTTKVLESHGVKDIGQQQKTMIISTGKDSSNATLGNSLSSMWNCFNVIKRDGLAVLVSECKGGLGSDALQQYLEGRLPLERLRNPTRYINGMEDLLFLSEIKKNFQIGLVSILPEFYTKKLGMIPLPGIKYSLDYILKTQGARQKVSIVTDGARLLLR